MSTASEQVAATAVPPAAKGNPQLLRFATAGSVDDGKSTLIGRLLYDAKSLHADALEAVTRKGALDPPPLTHGARAPRGQGITIPAAHPPLPTPRRGVITPRTPGAPPGT